MKEKIELRMKCPRCKSPDTDKIVNILDDNNYENTFYGCWECGFQWKISLQSKGD